jgi:hypothetical protein
MEKEPKHGKLNRVLGNTEFEPKEAHSKPTL